MNYASPQLEESFVYSAFKDWNSLDHDVTFSSILKGFKFRLNYL